MLCFYKQKYGKFKLAGVLTGKIVSSMGHRLLRVIFEGAFRRRLTAFPGKIQQNAQRPSLLLRNLALPQNIIVRDSSKGKSKGGKKPARVEIKNSEISQLLDVDQLKLEFQRPIEKMKDDFIQHLSIRSIAGSLETLKVKHNRKIYDLQQIAEISRPDTRKVELNLSSFPDLIPYVLQAIKDSGLNLSPQQEGTVLHCPVPKVTKEHRETLAKNARILYQKCKDTIRRVQLENVKKVKNSDKVSADLIWSVSKQIEMIAEMYIAEANQLLINKDTELLK